LSDALRNHAADPSRQTDWRPDPHSHLDAPPSENPDTPLLGLPGGVCHSLEMSDMDQDQHNAPT